MTNTSRPGQDTLSQIRSTLRSTFNFKVCTRLLFVGLAFALICFSLSLRTKARTAPTTPAPVCEENRNAPEIIRARWMPNSALKVMFARGEFSSQEISAFQEAIRLWQSVLPASGTGIDLQMGGEIAMGNNGNVPCASCIVVKRKRDLEGTFARLSMSSVGGFYNKATINIKGNVHKTTMLRMLLTHELGHAFGLDDCVECDGDTTVMNSVNKYAFGAFSFLAPRNKMAAAPTRCDVARVSDGYANAAMRQAQAIQSPSAAAAPRSAQFIKAVVSAPQSRSVSYQPAVVNNRATAAPSQRNHVSRKAAAAVGQPQRSIKVEQFVLMDALGGKE
ncbi:MAG TPA: hypothetical protein VM911_16830 [Pyrinomonadaceae bacterium]|nr:hypothetical protein [Pyrinomonadaceae bacterium]